MFCLVPSAKSYPLPYCLWLGARCVKGREHRWEWYRILDIWHDNGFLLIVGLTAYYRAFGRCGADVRKLMFKAERQKKRKRNLNKENLNKLLKREKMVYSEKGWFYYWKLPPEKSPRTHIVQLLVMLVNVSSLPN